MQGQTTLCQQHSGPIIGTSPHTSSSLSTYYTAPGGKRKPVFLLVVIVWLLVAGARAGVGDHVPTAPSGLGPEPEPEIGDWDEAGLCRGLAYSERLVVDTEDRDPDAPRLLSRSTPGPGVSCQGVRSPGPGDRDLAWPHIIKISFLCFP